MIASLIALGLTAVAAPAAVPPAEKAQAPAQAAPLLVAHADGSWEITRAIEEEAPALAFATDDLLTDEPDFGSGPLTRDALREAELDEQAEDAFEEAIDAARRDERPD